MSYTAYWTKEAQHVFHTIDEYLKKDGVKWWLMPSPQMFAIRYR